MTTTEPNQTSETSTRQAIRDRAVKRGLDILALDRINGLANANRSRLIAERLALKSQDGTLGEPTEMPQDAALDDMNISVGDTIINVPERTPTPSQTAPAEHRGATHKVWPYVLAAALAGGGLGVGGTAAYKLLRPETDADTQYELRLSTGDEITDGDTDER